MGITDSFFAKYSQKNLAGFWIDNLHTYPMIRLKDAENLFEREKCLLLGERLRCKIFIFNSGENMRNPIFFIITFTFFLICPINSSAFQNVKIQNHSFSVITEDMVKVDGEDEEEKTIKVLRTALFIQNDDCNIKYKAMFGKATLGEGETRLDLFPHIIRLGNNTLKIRCLAPNHDISVEEVE